MTKEDIPECNALAKHITGVFCNEGLQRRMKNVNTNCRWYIPFVLEEVAENSSKIVAFTAGITL